ncbi:MAG: type II toxin-antitoxin system RelE/ParE family toxin [Kiritimatiellae bacterium]|nr:type II toxin-antitoxin system RelE/ParE family toxin [Kiritimatiellia bacterium]
MNIVPFTVKWTPRGLKRLRDRQDWIEHESCSHEIAAAWADRIIAAADNQLPDFPRSGRIVPEINREDIRELIVEHTTRVIYKVKRASCDILSVRRSREHIGPSLHSL